MLALQSDLNGNCLLGALPPEEWRAIVHHLELVPLTAKAVLCDYSGPSTYIYFPTSAIISWLAAMEDGGSIELASVGREGAVCLLEYLTGAHAIPYRAQVQIPGFAYRIKKQDLTLTPTLQQVAMLYLQSFFIQVAQTAACNRHHTLEQQICRWLLIELDHTLSNALFITQLAVADALGRRRESVTSALTELEEQGVIGRGHKRLFVVDRKALESRACECYGVMRREFDRLCDHERFRSPISNSSLPSQL